MHAGHSHSHGIADGQNERLLRIALSLTAAFLVVELIGGILVKSLALISDAAHMFTDTAALAIALVAIRIGKRPADSQRTFGYYRFEILAAAFNAILLFLVAGYIVVEAYLRLQHPPKVQSTAMLIIAAIGLGVNLVSMRLLSAGKDSSLNVKGAYLEVWSDMLGSLGVILAALIIGWTGWSWVDSAVAVAIGLWVVPRTWVLLKASLNVLLEGVPEGIGLEKIEAAVLELPGTVSIHDLHVWSISSGKTSLTVHVVCNSPAAEWPTLLCAVRARLAQQFNIHHSTVQLEPAPCEQRRETHAYSAAHHSHEHGNDFS
jgi:cobalt-zinc-cadmium efflux system protein